MISKKQENVGFVKGSSKEKRKLVTTVISQERSEVQVTKIQSALQETKSYSSDIS